MIRQSKESIWQRDHIHFCGSRLYPIPVYMITPDQTGKVAHEIHLSLMMPRAMGSTENQDQITWWDAVDNRALEGHGFETPEIAIEYCKDAILKDMRGEKL